MHDIARMGVGNGLADGDECCEQVMQEHRILVAAFAGGRLFDAYEPWAPFAMVGAAQVLIFLLAVVVRMVAPGDMPARRT